MSRTIETLCWVYASKKDIFKELCISDQFDDECRTKLTTGIGPN